MHLHNMRTCNVYLVDFQYEATRGFSVIRELPFYSPDR